MQLNPKFTLMFGLPALLAGPVVFAQTLTFSKPTETALPSKAASQILPLDLNGDGNTDVAFDIGADGYALLGDGKGGFSGTPMKLSMQVGVYQDLVDLNGDGKSDILVLYTGGSVDGGPAQPGAFQVWIGDGKGNFKQTTNLVTPAADNASYAIGDFNGDGLPDIAYTDSSSAGDGGENALTIYLNQGNGAFKESLHETSDGHPGAVETGDFNHDGKIDLAYLTGSIKGSYQAYGLHYAFGNGNGTFQPDKVYVLDSAPTNMLAADFNHDGRTDLEVGLEPKSNSKGQYLPGQERRFATLLSKQTEGFYWLSSVDYWPDPIVPIALKDYNGDGTIDMLYYSINGYAIYPGKSDYTFGDSIALPSGLNNPFVVPLTKGGLPAIIDGNVVDYPTELRVFLNTSKK